MTMGDDLKDLREEVSALRRELMMLRAELLTLRQLSYLPRPMLPAHVPDTQDPARPRWTEVTCVANVHYRTNAPPAGALGAVAGQASWDLSSPTGARYL